MGDGPGRRTMSDGQDDEPRATNHKRRIPHVFTPKGLRLTAQGCRTRLPWVMEPPRRGVGR